MSPVTLSDISLKNFELTPRVRHLKDTYFRAVPEICTDRAGLITKYSKDLFQQRQISILDKAELYGHVLGEREAIVRHTKGYEKDPNEKDPKGKELVEFKFEDPQLFAGSTTSKFKGVPLYPEFFALAIWPELGTISKRACNPYHIARDDIEKLNHYIFPSWAYKNILELAREKCNLIPLEKLGFSKEKWTRQALENLGFEGTPPEYKPLKLMERIVFFLTSKPECISHTIPDFSRAIYEGLRKIINDAESRKDKTADKSKKQFYEAVSVVLKGVITYSKRLAKKARSLAESEDDPIAKKELCEIADIHDWVPENRARNFREGLTALWICWTALHLENPNIGLSLGRLDQVLYPLYREDKSLNLNSALELLCCLWLKIGDHVPLVPEAAEQLFGGNGSNQAITIGGVDEDGKDAVNDLTYMILRSIELMQLRDPNLNARYYPGINPPEYLIRLCEANINTGATPALHNDKAVIKALKAKGDPEKLARDYGIVGCVEPTSSGRTYAACAAILLNLTSALELTLFNGRHRHIWPGSKMGKETGDPERDWPRIGIETGDPKSFKSFGEFQTAFRRQTEWLISWATDLNRIFEEVHQDFYPTPILSAFFEGPMDKGMDLILGGAKINSTGATIIGLADVADSLSAIQKVVIDERAISFENLLDALKKNFQGYETLHLRLLNPDKTPKYGNGHPDAEANAEWIMGILDDAFGKKENCRGGRYRVGYWTMTNHAGFGRIMKAFPNGRKDGEPFASGITPVSGVTPFLPEVLKSVAEKPAKYLSNGVALNLKFTPGIPPRDLADHVEAYFDDQCGKRDGGMEIQFNIIAHDKFEDAADHPEKYPELLVRVSGYTAYFKDLNQQMQEEIINRTEYPLSSGRAMSYKTFHFPKDRDKEVETDIT